MKIQIIERSKLMRAEWARNFSNITMDAITDILVTAREEKGHDEAEAIAKEIRLLIETGISEIELMEKLNHMN